MSFPSSARSLFNLKARFIKSVAQLSQLPDHDMPEIAFSGRSNVGKSSLINALTVSQEKQLAMVSKTPGRTQTLNFFQVGQSLMLVDLPGYGFAKVPKTVKEKWGALNEDYLLTRKPELQATYVLIDSRRGILPIDFDWMCMLRQGRVPFKIALTKTDRVGASALETVTLACQKQYEQICGTLQPGDVVATRDILRYKLLDVQIQFSETFYVTMPNNVMSR